MAELFFKKDKNANKAQIKKIPSVRRTGEQKIELSNNVQWNSRQVMRLNMHTYLPLCIQKCCRCLRPNQEQASVSMTYKKLLREISVERILRQLRVLNAAARKRISH